MVRVPVVPPPVHPRIAALRDAPEAVGGDGAQGPPNHVTLAPKARRRARSFGRLRTSVTSADGVVMSSANAGGAETPVRAATWPAFGVGKRVVEAAPAAPGRTATPDAGKRAAPDAPAVASRTSAAKRPRHR